MPTSTMKYVRGALVEVKDEGPKVFDVNNGIAKKGAILFKAKCAACHSCVEGGPTKQGPNLYGIMGAKAASATGYKFTKNLKTADITWENETMAEWLANPKKFVKGTTMAFAGLKK